MTPQSTVGQRSAKNALFDGFGAVASAMASGRRVEIVALLAQGERSVESIADAIEQSVANASHHLRTLARAGLLATRRDGTRIYYRLADQRVFDLWAALRDVTARHLATMGDLADGFLGDRSEVPTISQRELRKQLDSDRMLLIDVRPLVEYDAGHIPGAIPVPPDRLDELLPKLPKDREIVAYCRGPYCVYADEAVRMLMAEGRSARRLEEGLPEWRRKGGAIASNTATS